MCEQHSFLPLLTQTYFVTKLTFHKTCASRRMQMLQKNAFLRISSLALFQSMVNFLVLVLLLLFSSGIGAFQSNNVLVRVFWGW